MKPVKGYYSLIQYCPDLSRLEAANIGVLLFCPELQFLKARTDESDARVRKIFGVKGNERWRIKSLRKAIEERLSIRQQFITLEDLEQFITTRANAVQLTKPRPMKVFNPEVELEELFSQLVAEPRKREGEVATDSTARLEESLERAFASDAVQPKIRRNIPVEIPVFRRQIIVPYGFKNGHFNLIQPAHFVGKTAIDRACKFAIEGQSLAERPYPELGELRLTVVGEFAQKQHDTRETVHSILSEHGVRLFSQENIDRLVEEIIKTGKVLPA
jgi:hypothetical protein